MIDCDEERLFKRVSIVLWVVFSVIVLSLTGHCAEPINVDKMVDAIYVAEGGSHTPYPYGIKSVKCSNATVARQVCHNTVVNNIKRWEQAGSQESYIVFLANRYCPVKSDPVGNANWIRNVTKLYSQKGPHHVNDQCVLH